MRLGAALGPCCGVLACCGLLATPALAQFTNVSGPSGLNTSGAKDGGLAWADFDQDGCLDVLVNTSVDNANGRSRLYRQEQSGADCAGTFLDETDTRAAGLTGFVLNRSAIWGDLDNDGDLDFARNISTRVEVYLNSGAPAYTFGVGAGQTPNQSFTSWSTTAIFNTEGMAFLDFDGDGVLEMVIEDHNGGIVLLENDGAGSLSETDPGVTGLPTGGAVDGDYLTVGDIDRDGDVDILARKGGAPGLDLWLNDGDGTFTSGSFNEPADNGDKGGVVLCDLDNDGDFDFFWTQAGTNQIWEQTTPGVFVATGEPAASSGETPAGVDGVACGDVDLDGDLDLFLANDTQDRLYLNAGTGDLTFTHNNLGITGNQNGEGAMFADYDNDGDLDLLINQSGANQLWRNDTANSDHLVVEVIIDLGADVGRPALGAVVELSDVDGNRFGPVQQVASGSGHGTGGDGAGLVFFGLPGALDDVVRVEVDFPDGENVVRCLVPSALAGPRRVARILDTDADDLAACMPTPGDSDGDGLLDDLEVMLGTDPFDKDSDDDGINDFVETDGGEMVDTDGDGTQDALDIDSDADGVTDFEEGVKDSDGDGTPDYRDPDDDNDGIDTRLEHDPWDPQPGEETDGMEHGTDVDVDGLANYLDPDSDGDGAPDALEGRDDTDMDGIPDYLDADAGDPPGPDDPVPPPDLVTDTDGDGIPDDIEGDDDVDGDGIPNFEDLDSDGDGKSDEEEGIEDDDADGVRNFVDPDDDDGPNADADGDGLGNLIEVNIGTDPYDEDSDDDGVDDGVEVGVDLSNPINSDGEGPIDALDPDVTGGPQLGIDVAIEALLPGQMVVGETAVIELIVTNIGTATTYGDVDVIDVLATGLSLADSGGDDWLCSTEGQKVSCRHDTPFQPGAGSVLTLHLSVGEEALPSVTHAASVQAAYDADVLNNITPGVQIPVVAAADVADPDGDGIFTVVDNCPDVPNPDQADLDGDGQGDFCDPDADGDGFQDNGVVVGGGCGCDTTTPQGHRLEHALGLFMGLAGLAWARRRRQRGRR